MLIAGDNHSILNTRQDVLAVGAEETFSRDLAQGSPQLATGNMVLSYFRARRSEAINYVFTDCLGTAAGGATLRRIGVFSVKSSGNLTLVASTANDTTLWASTCAGYKKQLSATWNKVAGQWYAVGFLFVGTTGPKLASLIPNLVGAEYAKSPRGNGNVSGQADLPATVTAASVAGSQGVSVYASVSTS